MLQPIVTAIVPCFNERDNISKTIKRLKKVVDEVIVVDNGSTDDSVTVALSCGVQVVSESKKQNGIGYGFAHQAGYRYANGDIIVSVDADGEHAIEKIPEIVDFLQENNCDFVSCNRVVTESNHINTKIRRFGIWLLSTEVTLLYGQRIKDILSGMWVFRREILSDLHLTEGGWNLSPQIKLAALSKKNIRFAEFPITATVRNAGESKQILWKTALEHGLFIANYRLDLLRKSLIFFRKVEPAKKHTMVFDSYQER